MFAAAIVLQPISVAAEWDCKSKSNRAWVEELKEVAEANPAEWRLNKAVQAALEAVKYPDIFVSTCHARIDELIAAAREFRHKGQQQFAMKVLFVLALIGTAVVSAAVAYLLSCRKSEPPAETAAETITRLKQDLTIIRLENSIEAEKMWTRLGPLKIEAKGANILRNRDERLLGAVIARRSLDEVLGQGQAPRVIEDPLSSAVAALTDEIENRKADGQPTADLDEALNKIRRSRYVS
jgi:hypothetical protein